MQRSAGHVLVLKCKLKFLSVHIWAIVCGCVCVHCRVIEHVYCGSGVQHSAGFLLPHPPQSSCRYHFPQRGDGMGLLLGQMVICIAAQNGVIVCSL